MAAKKHRSCQSVHRVGACTVGTVNARLGHGTRHNHHGAEDAATGHWLKDFKPH